MIKSITINVDNGNIKIKQIQAGGGIERVAVRMGDEEKLAQCLGENDAKKLSNMFWTKELKKVEKDRLAARQKQADDASKAREKRLKAAQKQVEKDKKKFVKDVAKEVAAILKTQEN